MGSTFIPSRCAKIDEVGSNTLIRGNMPLMLPDLHYAYKEIEEASEVSLTGKVFIEIPIIDNVGERQQFVAIMKAFGIDPDKFPTSFWPWWLKPGYNPNALLGSTLTTEGLQVPACVLWRPFEGLPEGEDPTMYLGPAGWDYGGFIDNLIRMLHSARNTVFYVHCQLGADRTGAAHIGYLMKAKGLNLDEASVIANSSTSAGSPNNDYQRLAEAYAKTLV